MNIGSLLMLLAFAAMLVSTIAFFLAARGNARFFSLARVSYGYFIGLVALAGALLAYYFLAGDYSFKYVYDYSSSDLSFFYRLSGFWAGQPGTYLLWLLIQGLLGYYLILRGRQYTAPAMVFYGLVNLFLGIMVLVLSPFEKLPIVPPDGAGLNPLLKDSWMVIHPPVIFLGYAAAALPCVIALAALVKRNYDDWLEVSWGPVTLTMVALAAGNIMGGFWAYKTLGWGGYWAWDPVENSSFIPWMVALALLHGMVLERAKGALRKTNLFLSIFVFLLVVYGTFLTRSGVLANFSVHSFVDLGVNTYLIAFMLAFTILSLVVYAVRGWDIKGAAVNLSAVSKEFALMVAVWALVLIALVVLSGTSWPLITTALGKPGTVDTGVYTKVTFPLAVVIGFFLGFSPFMLRAGGSFPVLLRKVIPSIVGAVVATAATALLGVSSFGHLLFVFFVAMAFFSNLIASAGVLRGRPWHSGAQVSHFGLALMLIGILGSSAYSENRDAVIEKGRSANVFGLDVAYKGMAADITTPDNEIILSISRQGEAYDARPKLFWVQRMGSLMKKPAIRRHLLYDLYFAPEKVEKSEAPAGLELSKGQTVTLGGYAIKFTGFEQQSHATGSPTRFGAVLEVTDGAGRTETVVPAMAFGADQQLHKDGVPLMTGLDSLPVRLEKIDADRGAILVSIPGLTPSAAPETLILEVSKKPSMNVLWGGASILVVGGLISLRRRWAGRSSAE